MNIGRIFANAIARRVAFVLVAVVLAWLGFGEARAQTYPGYPECENISNGMCPDEGAATAALHAQLTAYGAAQPGNIVNRSICIQPQMFPGTSVVRGSWVHESITCSVTTASGGNGADQRRFPTNNTCETRPAERGSWNAALVGDTVSMCVTGCTYNRDVGFNESTNCSLVTGGEWPGLYCSYMFTPSGETCTADDAPTDPNEPDECGAGQVQLPDGSCGEQSDCPVGQHKVDGECHPTGSCPTGQVKAPDGSCAAEGCGAGQAKGSDGTCKPDSDGDGEPDTEEDDGTFSGGETCNTPPLCSGDNILCGQARIQWRIDCNTRKNTSITGGNGCGPGSVPICTGEKCNAVEYAQLLQAYATKCAVEALAEGGGGDPGGPGDGDADNNGVPDVLEGNIAGEPGGEPGVDEVGEGVWEQVDQGGWLGGGSCPGLPDDIDPRLGVKACEQGALLRDFMGLLGLVLAAGIIGRAAAGA